MIEVRGAGRQITTIYGIGGPSKSLLTLPFFSTEKKIVVYKRELLFQKTLMQESLWFERTPGPFSVMEMDSNQSGAVGGIIWGPFPGSWTHLGAS